MLTEEHVRQGHTRMLGKIREADPMKLLDMKMAWACRFLIQNTTCKLTELNEMMPEFWDDYFQGSVDWEEWRNLDIVSGMSPAILLLVKPTRQLSGTASRSASSGAPFTGQRR